MSHYYTKQGPSVKWSLPLVPLIMQENLNMCQRPECGRQIPRRDGGTETEYQKRRFCCQKCRDKHNDNKLVVKASAREIGEFKSWLVENGYELRSREGKGFKIKDGYRMMNVYKSSGNNWRFAQGSIKLFNKYRSSE